MGPQNNNKINFKKTKKYEKLLAYDMFMRDHRVTKFMFVCARSE